MAPPPSPSNEEMDFGVVTKSFLDRLFGKGDSTSASGEGMDAELEALLEREGQVNIITLRSVSNRQTEGTDILYRISCPDVDVYTSPIFQTCTACVEGTAFYRIHGERACSYLRSFSGPSTLE